MRERSDRKIRVRVYGLTEDCRKPSPAGFAVDLSLRER
jgi:hypothetical protein